jgi:sn-glycerol 3-phosphate transport system substrate-binding protein
LAGSLSARSAPAVISRQGSDVEISFWYGFGGANGERIQALVDGFNALGTGIRVNALQQSTYEETAQNLTIALQDGSAPDVAVLSDVWWFRFYLASALLPLDDLIAANPAFAFEDLLPSIRDEGRRAGRLYWLPFARSTPIVYYDRQRLADAGLDAFPVTWSEFEAVAPSLADESQQVAALALPFAPTVYGYTAQGIVWAFGGAYSDADLTIRLNEPSAVSAGAMLRRGIEAGWAAASETYADDVVAGFAAASIASTGGLANLSATAEASGINLGTAFLPGETEGVDIHCPSGGSGLSIMASSSIERQQAAFAFIQYLSAYEQTVPWALQTGYLPIRASAIEGPEVAEAMAANTNYAVAVQQFPMTRPQDAARTFIPNGDQIIGTGFGEIVVNGTDPQAAFDAAAGQLATEAQPVIEQIRALEGESTPVA